MIAARDVVVADNALNGPINTSGSNWRNVYDTQDLHLQKVVMSIGTSFRVQNYDAGPTNATGCSGQIAGRGCLYLTGGLIQEKRGPVGMSNGYGYVKRYSYDRCANYHPPPYFPTTGRYLDNRYYELDPVQLNVAELFERLTPGL